MKKQYKKIIEIWMVCIICLSSLIQNVYGGESDIANHWAKEQLQTWEQKGILKGDGGGEIRPNDPITRAEFFAIVNRVFGFFEATKISYRDVDEVAWYAIEIGKGTAAGYIEGFEDNTARPEQSITREEAAVIITRVFQLDKEAEDTHFYADHNEIHSWSQKAVQLMSQKGYLQGYPDKTFRPQGSLTRAEAVTMLYHITGEICNQPGVYEIQTEGNVVINHPDSTLKDTMIGGNLYLLEGIGEGEVILDHVTVQGEVIVRGGGENSVFIQDSRINKIRVKKDNGKIRIVAAGKTNVEEVVLESGAKLEEIGVEENYRGFFRITADQEIPEGAFIELLGEFEGVYVYRSNIHMNLLKGMIGDLNVYGGMSLELGPNTRIMKSTLHTADKIHVAGKGKIDILELRERGASLEATQGIIGKIVSGNQEETTTGSRDQQDNNQSDPPDSNEPNPDEPDPDEPDPNAIKITEIFVNEEENQVEIRGVISSAEEKEVTLGVKDPEGNWSMLDQTTTNGNDGVYTFIYELTREIFGTYAVYVGGEGAEVPAHGSFTVYPGTDATVSQIAYRINDQVYEIFIEEGVEVYQVLLRDTSHSMPEVHVTSQDKNAKVIVQQVTELPGIAAIIATAEDGVTTKTYWIQFKIENEEDLTTIEADVRYDPYRKKVMISGQISSGEGQEVTVKVVNAYTEEICYVDQTTSVLNGEYSFGYIFVEEADHQLYDVYVSGANVPNPVERTLVITKTYELTVAQVVYDLDGQRREAVFELDDIVYFDIHLGKNTDEVTFEIHLTEEETICTLKKDNIVLVESVSQAVYTYSHINESSVEFFIEVSTPNKDHSKIYILRIRKEMEEDELLSHLEWSFSEREKRRYSFNKRYRWM